MLLGVEGLAALVLVDKLAEGSLVVLLVELGLGVRVVLVLELAEVDGVDGVARELELAGARVVGAREGCGGRAGGDGSHCEIKMGMGEWAVKRGVGCEEGERVSKCGAVE